VVVWSVLSLVALLGGIGALFAVYGRFSAKVGWQSAEAPAISFRQPGDIALTPAQKATAWFFFTIAGLFLVQTLLGAAAEHYRADILSFFGIDLARLLRFNLARTWHLQLALFWTAASFLAAGIFLTPFIAGREPKKQSILVYALFGAVVLVVVGSLVSEALSIHGVSWAKGPLFSQQWEYLDLPRI
jgi:nitric oxide reductase subunit B